MAGRRFIYDIDGGVELRTRFWLGWTVVDKKPVRGPSPLPESASNQEFILKAATLHNVKEYNNLAKILPLVYAEEKGKLE